MKVRTAVLTAVFLVAVIMTGCHGINDNPDDYSAEAEIDAKYTEQADNEKEPDAEELKKDAAVDKNDGEVSANEGTNKENNIATESSDSNIDYSMFDNALFIGDSRTEGLQLYSGIKNADFFCAKGMTIDKINAGDTVYFSGGKQVSIYDVLGSKVYNRVYIGLGMNELGMNYIEDYVDEYNKLIAYVKERQPDAVIYVQALIPVTHAKSESHEYVNNAQIYWYNIHIADIAESNNVIYVNADAPLINENGELIDDATTDGVHMNKEYCQKWAAELARLTP